MLGTMKEQETGYTGRVMPLIIGVVGPSGTGKSTLAKKIARMITRSEHSPNVLLMDADIYGRGLTAQVEGSREFQCKNLYDVIVGKDTGMNPVELPESCIGLDEWPSLPEDGRVYFVPSSRSGTARPSGAGDETDCSELKLRLTDAITSASNSGRAEAIVVDTAPVPDPCGAIFASMCDLIVLIGDEDHGEEAIKEHVRRLEELGANLGEIPVEIVFNQMNVDSTGRRAGQSPVNRHVIPSLSKHDTGGFEIADSVDFELRVIGIVTPFFSRAHPGLVPSWCAPLPGEWRKVAMVLGESPMKDPRLLHLFPRIAPPFLKRAAFALGIGIPALACLFLTSSISNTNSASATSGSSLRYLGLAIGLCFLLLAVLYLFRVSVECKTCLVAASRLAAKDINWILSRLRLEPKHQYKSAPEKRRKLRGQKLNTLHRIFDTLGRSIQETERLR